MFARLAGEAGFRLGEDAQDRASRVLNFEAGRTPTSARLAVSLLSMVTVAQARRIAASGENAATITRRIFRTRSTAGFRAEDYWRPGQYF